MGVDYHGDLDKAEAWFQERGWYTSKKGPGAILVGTLPWKDETGLYVIERSLFLEMHGETWHIRGNSYGSSLEDVPCKDLQEALELGAHLLTLSRQEYAAFLLARE